MNKYLQRSYFLDDQDGFYSKRIFLQCSEQIKYQLLRDYKVDYQLFLCDDINMSFCIYDNYENIFPYGLSNINDIFVYMPLNMTQNVDEQIEQLIQNEQIVIFRSGFNKIKMYKWYGVDSNEYEMTLHKAMLVGLDDDNYYILESPHLRNIDYYVPHPLNSEIGIITKKEFYEALDEYSEIGYMFVDEDEMYSHNGIHEVLKNIIDNYNTRDILYLDGHPYCIGIRALEEFICSVKLKKYIKNFYTMPFVCEVFISRYMRLKQCIQSYIGPCEAISEINEIIGLWNMIKLLVIKQTFLKRDDVYYVRLSLKIDDLIKGTDRLMRCIKEMLI